MNCLPVEPTKPGVFLNLCGVGTLLTVDLEELFDEMADIRRDVIRKNNLTLPDLHKDRIICRSTEGRFAHEHLIDNTSERPYVRTRRHLVIIQQLGTQIV